MITYGFLDCQVAMLELVRGILSVLVGNDRAQRSLGPVASAVGVLLLREHDVFLGHLAERNTRVMRGAILVLVLGGDTTLLERQLVELPEVAGVLLSPGLAVLVRLPLTHNYRR